MRLLKFLWWTCVAIFCGVLLSLSGAYLYLSPNLPSVDALRNVQLQIPLRVYSSDNKLIAEFGEMRRTPIRFADIPPDFIHALLSAEDDNFANHYGVDVKSLMRAAAQLLTTGHIQTGGSTITMQVAKNYFLTNERSFSRKITEILLALQIERELTKDEILELYINKIYLGNRAYGIEAAAQVYFGKPIKELSLAQMAMIAGLPKAPSRYNPLANVARSMERRNWILERMNKLGFIDQARYQAAVAEPVGASYHVPSPELNAPYIAEMARAEMVGRYGSNAYTDGYRVYTTVHSDLQENANDALRDGLQEYDQRHGYRGPEARLPGKSMDAWRQAIVQQRPLGGLEPAIVTRVEKSGVMVLLRDGKDETISWDNMKWARPFLSSNSMGPVPRQPSDVLQAGDVIRVQRRDDGSLRLTQVPAAQSALVSLNPRNGAIMALVGGFSFEQSNYNRAAQAKRQPGSSFKPFIYSCALDNGFTAASLVNDAPIVFVDEYLDKVWRPKNDTNTFLGPIPLREALYKSRNMVSIRVLQSLGVERARNYISRFGFDIQELPPNLSMALGTATLTPLEIAGAWSTFANGGYKVSPYVVERIESRDGQVLYQAKPGQRTGRRQSPGRRHDCRATGRRPGRGQRPGARQDHHRADAGRAHRRRPHHLHPDQHAAGRDQARYRPPRPGAETRRPGGQDRHHQRLQGRLVLRLQRRLHDHRLGWLRPAGKPGPHGVRRQRRTADLDALYGRRAEGQTFARAARAAGPGQPADRSGHRSLRTAGHAGRLLRTVQERRHPAANERTGAR